MLNIPTILHNLLTSRSNSSASVIIDVPSDMDVLCGRDRNFLKHQGNVIYRQEVEIQASAYALATTKPAKMKITKAIVHTMQTKYGSRFLRRTENNHWEVLTNVQARDKTSHALRFINNNNSSYSSTRSDDCEKADISSDYQTGGCSSDSTLKKPSKAVKAMCVSSGDWTASSPQSNNVTRTTGNIDDATSALHQRQMELLRVSIQNDDAMDVGIPMNAQNLMQCPLFSISGLDLMNESRSFVATPNEFMHSVHDHHTKSYDDDIRLDSIRTTEMRDIINRPVDDTLRSEELNFLMNDIMMDEA